MKDVVLPIRSKHKGCGHNAFYTGQSLADREIMFDSLESCTGLLFHLSVQQMAVLDNACQL